jgi:hypothetical protein
MRQRPVRTVLATAAAGAAVTITGLAVAGPVDATAAGRTTAFAPSAPQIATAPCSAATSQAAPVPFGGGGCAGYVGSGRDFRYAQAIITVPQATVVPLTGPAVSAAAPTLYVGLTGDDAMAAAGLMNCANFVIEFPSMTGPCQAPTVVGRRIMTSADNSPLDAWVAVGWVVTSSGTRDAEAVALPDVNPGDGIKFQVYYPAGGAAHFTITTPGPTPTAHSFQLPSAGTLGAVFDYAVALADYSVSDLGGTPARPGLDPGPAPGAADLRITQFRQGAWTTTSGDRGTFAGPWTLNAATLTSDGFLPPAGTVHVEPSHLWNDGMGSGAGDAFGVWWRH